MTNHEKHEESARRVFQGSASPEEVRRAEACAECTAELARLRAVEGRLEGLGRIQREDWRAARQNGDDADRDLMRQGLQRVVRGRRLRRLTVALVAAAGLVLGGFLLYRGASVEPAPRIEILLGEPTGTLELTAPLGQLAGASYGPFSWRETDPGTNYRLTLYTVEGGRRGDAILSIQVTEPRWSPDENVERTLPAVIFWRVEVLDPFSMQEGEHGQGWAARSAP